ncbi:MAG: PSD1 and planctomycete cytochrome C domain-containing protein [Pirellulaceae bacterium]|jgi:hypothetical protein|nr:PSD1 and planctomycete cytochrome C domain-containing protein [Pirellulaceae bacterium]MDP7016956.1 PSD1 and planctomycete cytochrome C domain-containing protein [Pirellulaceae bacterium]
MTTPSITRPVPLIIAITLLGSSTALAAEPPQVDFVQQIQPILRAKCHKCHGPDQSEAGLRLDYKKAALAGGDNGAVIAPGKSNKSRLFLGVLGSDEDKRMPPVDEGERLAPADVALFRAWIDQGANWPDGVDRGAGENRLGADHWAFQPLVRPEPPTLDEPWPRNEIDAFVLRRLRKEGVEPAGEAERHALIRRIYLDLIGLPPTPAEMQRWIESPDEQWLERLVDQLLDSPHFGERWGRHWLDLARYADSDGYEKDLPRPHAWRWRDWVIAAINRDLPFDQFTIEQLAGDLLPNASVDQRIATGFHRNTLTNREGGVDQEEYRIKAVKDRVYTTGTVWLGMTAQCSECHSHKFDPFSQREYYRLASFFNNADQADIAAPLPGETAAYEKAKTAFDNKLAELKRALADANASLVERQRGWEKRLNVAEAPARKEVPAQILATLGLPAEQRSADRSVELTKFYRGIDPLNIRLNKALDAHAKTKPKPPTSKAQAFTERSEPRDNYVHQRGDFRRPGQPVRPGTLEVLHPFKPRGEYPDRLDLARWLVDPANPLTPRVAVNRIWQHLFGRGIVETTWDFGTQGAPPTHPELIDWLASEYIRRGWSRKAMIKLIVSSATYRQSSAARPELQSRDPKNDWIARQNRFRLDAEIVRDLYLKTSDLLHPAVGGPSVYPPLPADVAALGYAGSVKWRESKAPNKYRRGMYIFFQRSVPYPMLTTFDAPESTVVSTRRDRSNTPLQSLTLLNDPVFVECSRALGLRIIQSPPDDVDGKIRYAFKLCLGRDPDAYEAQRLRQLQSQLLELYESDSATAETMAGESSPTGVTAAQVAAWTAFARTMMNLDEFVTRE